MNSWIIQGNPDTFDLDTYLSRYRDIRWTVGQKYFKDMMNIGDEVYIWRSAGSKHAIAGIVAFGHLTSKAEEMVEDDFSNGLWVTPPDNSKMLRVNINIEKVSLDSKAVVQRAWMMNDPILHDHLILKFASQTTYKLSDIEALRINRLIMNTGRDWNSIESLAGLWAYAMTMGKEISKLPDSPVAEIALTIGRAVPGVYNKVMNFRALDPTDSRMGLTAGSKIDKETWDTYFDTGSNSLDIKRIEADYRKYWLHTPAPSVQKVTYTDFGDAPNDDPKALQMFAAHVRKGQPSFRKNLLKAYGEKCVITGYCPADVLEAVHIVDHAISGINKMDNGLLLRADLHSLFDANLLMIDPTDYSVWLEPSLKETPYWELNGRILTPRVDGNQPSKEYLEHRWKESTQYTGRGS